ncbi:MAG: DUF4124 domain-containing protein [Geobacter sp.]|nr:DUF4124 domain-containing protein [Geobacter sp.]
MKMLFVMILFLATVAPVSADTYQWTDKKGVVHFTDNPDKIPRQNRKKARKRPSVKSETPVISPTTQPLSAPKPVEKKEAAKAPPLYAGHDEKWWRSTTGNLRTELAKLTQELPDKRDKLQFLRRRWTISIGRTPKEGESLADIESYTNKSALSAPGKNREAYYAIKNEIESDEARIKQIEQELADLELLATKAGVPREWIK